MISFMKSKKKEVAPGIEENLIQGKLRILLEIFIGLKG